MNSSTPFGATSIYVLSVEKALAAWKRLLKPGGFVVFNDLVWLTDNRSQEAAEFWSREQPDSLAFNDIATEIAIYEKYLSEFGYQFFIARKVG